jgi:hypothetical protein
MGGDQRMTKIAIVPNAAGTGTFTIEAPNSNSNRTLVLPDAAGELLTDVSDIETQVKAATNATGSAPVYACRAWVNFDGTGTVAIRESGNVSSITDNGTGNYTINFTTAMPDANYAWNIGIGRTSAENGAAQATTSAQVPLAGSLRVNRFDEANISLDEEFMCVTIFR